MQLHVNMWHLHVSVLQSGVKSRGEWTLIISVLCKKALILSFMPESETPSWEKKNPRFEPEEFRFLIAWSTHDFPPQTPSHIQLGPVGSSFGLLSECCESISICGLITKSHFRGRRSLTVITASERTSKLCQLYKGDMLITDALPAAFDMMLTVSHNRFWNALLQFVLILQEIHLLSVMKRQALSVGIIHVK